MSLEATVEGGTARVVVSSRDFPTNRGGLCQKGWTSAEVLRAPDRLTHPWVRRSGVLAPASWDEALATVASRVLALQSAHGRDCVGVFGGGGLTNEKAYLLGKFARLALGTRFIDYNGRFCMAAAAAAGNRAFGIDRGLPFPVSDLDGAQAVLLLGSNVADTMPPFVQHLAGARRAGGLVVVDPRRSATAALCADGGGLHLQPLPGADQVLLLGLLHVLARSGRVDASYVEARTVGWEATVRSVADLWPERVASLTGVPAPQVERAAHLLADAAPAFGGGGAVVLTGRGVEQHVDGSDTVAAAINLALALGLPGRPASGYGCLTGQGNGQGGREHGQKADQLPGYRSIADPAARAHVAAVWGVDPEVIPGPGVPAVELLARCGSSVRALFVHGSNPVVSAPDVTSVTRRLRSLDLLVVSDVVPSETAQLADVVLPVTQWAEEEGTVTSLEGRVLRRRRAVAPPPGVRDELEVLADLAARLGCAVPFETDPALVFDELARASAGGRADYSGLSHAVLDDGDARFWPAAAGGGTPRLFTERFAHEDGRARFHPVRPSGPADDLRPDAPLHLVTGRVLAHYQSGAQTRRVPALVDSSPAAFAEVHPRLAERLGLHDGEPAEVESARGVVVVPVRVTTAVRPDTVFMPFHWPGSANVLTTDATDPVSGMPQLKVCAVQVRPLAPEAVEPAPQEVPARPARPASSSSGPGWSATGSRTSCAGATPPGGSTSGWSAPRRTSPTTGSC
jgi:assimilatory nitrate reductase catalytic subunit